MKISAFIPVYRQPKHLEALVRSLSAEDFHDSETIVVVDGETTPEIASALEAVRRLPRVKIVEGVPHLGKAAALNRAVASTSSGSLLFLDNDIRVEPGIELFRGCSRLLETCSLVELPKAGAGKGPVAAMMKQEFLANLVGTKIIVNRSGRSPSMNGAAFAVRRSLFRRLDGFAPTINEDVDFAARAFLAGARFGLDPSTRVLNDVPETLAEWYRQRKRWSINFGLWTNTYLSKFKKEAPAIARSQNISSLIFGMPFVTALVAVIAVFVGFVTHGGEFRGIFVGLSGIAAFWLCGSYFAKEAKYFGQKFSWISYLFYSLVYCPIWAISSIIGTIVVRERGVPEMDWKYEQSDKGEKSASIAQ